MVLLRFDKESKKWNQIDQSEKQEGDLYLDGKLKEKLDYARNLQKKDFDAGGALDGSEGSGKSNLAGNIMRYMSNDTFDPVKHIIKDTEHAVQVLQDIPDGSAVMFDEGYLLFSATEVMMKGQRDLVKIFSIIRQKNLFVLIVAPSFFRINAYFALERTKFLIHVYNKNDKRGFFSYYGARKKEKLYRQGKKNFNSYHLAPNFRGRFTKCHLFGEEYKQIKRETLKEAFKVAEVKKTKTPGQIMKDKEMLIIAQNINKSTKVLAEILNMTERNVRLKKAEIKSKISAENPLIPRF